MTERLVVDLALLLVETTPSNTTMSASCPGTETPYQESRWAANSETKKRQKTQETIIAKYQRGGATQEVPTTISLNENR